MISLDNMVWILRREVAALQKDLQDHAYTDAARRHKHHLVRLLEGAIEDIEAYIRESQRLYVPVLDVAGSQEGCCQSNSL